MNKQKVERFLAMAIIFGTIAVMTVLAIVSTIIVLTL